MTEQELADIKRKTVPQEESDYYRNPIHHQPTTLHQPHKSYSEVETFEQQQTFKQNYHNPKLKDLMNSATQVLLALMQNEGKLK